MANITELIKNIRQAILGKEVRESIAGAIEQCYEDASKNGNANMEVAEARGNFDTLNQRLDDSDDKLQMKRDKGTYITMGDLDQDVKTAMTGGSVAVVGNKSVNSATIQNNSISSQNLQDVEIFTKNLLDITLFKKGYAVNSLGNEVISNDYMVSDYTDIGDYTVNQTVLYTNSQNGALALYDADKSFLQYMIDSPHTFPLNIENVKYVRLNVSMKQQYINTNNIYLVKNSKSNYTDIKANEYDHSMKNYIRIPTKNLFGNDISPINCNFITHNTNNLFNKYLADKNGYFDNDGSFISNIIRGTNTYSSMLMKLPVYIPNETVFYQGTGTGCITLYDINMNYIGSLEEPNLPQFTIPYENCVYIAKTLLQTEIYDYYLIPNTSDLIDEYILNPEIKIENANVNNILYNKKIGFLGDSITYGLGATKPYPTVIQEKINCISLNYGISGNSIAKAGSNGQENAQNNPMCVRYNTMALDLDYILIFGGTNDYAYQIPIGESNSNDITTFNGALNTLIKGLIERYPGKPILFLTPLHRALDYENGIKFNEYVEAIMQRSSYYSVPYFNLTDRSTIDSLIDTINNMYYSNQDRLHPNDEGHKILARIIQHQLEII